MSRALQLLINSSNGVGLPYEGRFRVDDSVLEQFPEGTIVISASRFRSSGWTNTALLHLRLSDGSEERYFLKSAPGYHGRVMMEGEYSAMTELFKWAPELVPKPHSWGEYSLSSPEAYFFIIQYIENTGDMPDANQLCSKLAVLHFKSQSPNGQFGFDVTTCQGWVPQAVAWQRSWTAFFTQLLKHVTNMNADVNGYWEDLDVLEKRLVANVIPRLLDALERNGRTVKPCSIHSDLWEGNTATSLQDGKVFIFDSAAFYAHNEMEIGSWRCYYNRISDEDYTSAYLRHVEPSEPREEWDDRNQLYSIYYNVIYSVNHLDHGIAVRQR
ncbi:kinase [Grosmannia clavigera kw1407]|uniref:protein-ribulosamine 3-kinase n=1 Tax=Grosmannia clavigera (strain kw1407 / UAMH 11150) TaxID=655863 RepID=F0XII8_GROCL|nr:kinase [Grosmannia clavigera kw1407]EFX02465.1 kinase [Grosmannia clavigera kw1407]